MNSDNNNITLEGSASKIFQCFENSLYSILYHRGIYPADCFRAVHKYGGVLVPTLVEERSYVDKTLPQIYEWLFEQVLKQLLVVLCSPETGAVIERWQFTVAPYRDTAESSADDVPDMSHAMFVEQMSRTLRQIGASSCILPAYDFQPTLTLMCVAEDYVEPDDDWEDQDREALEIEGGAYVRLNSIDAADHCIEPLIHYQVHSFDHEEGSDHAPELPAAQEGNVVEPDEAESDGDSESAPDNYMETDDEYECYCFGY
ncbi:DNA-binding protein [Radiomyces spectabilis]|uniref:DNA-binding protein n=1 Tax=Radiomyces spectabilis TaxID=64574 RepID=UPI00221F44EC|nr:DNA-binding protein [Radiomyces spectabilis]KAI8380924.1 DNA-binding protein [Radiomyces spectabilis]